MKHMAALILFGCAAAAAEPPLTGTLAEYTAPGDTLAYTFTLTAFGARANATVFSLKAADSVTAASGWALGAPVCDKRNANTGCVLSTATPNVRGVWWSSPTLVTPFVLTNTMAWDSASFRLIGWGINTVVGKWSPDSTVLATWRVRRIIPAPPPGGTLDSSKVVAITITPDSAGITRYLSSTGVVDSVRPDSLRFCAWAQHESGAVTAEVVDWSIAGGPIGPQAACWTFAASELP